MANIVLVVLISGTDYRTSPLRKYSHHMPDIHLVIDYLKTRLGSHVADAKKDQFNDWLNKLAADRLGAVLGYNLYIDLKNNCLDDALVIDVINRMVTSHSHPRDCFCVCLEDEAQQLRYICKHARREQSLEGDRYIKISSLDSMIEHYFMHALGLPNATSLESQTQVLDLFFEPPDGEKMGLGIIEGTIRGRMKNVWVTSKNELDELRDATPPTEFANIVRDRLGFDELNDGKLVGIVYPIDFNRAKAYVPTTLDAHSGCHFFISFVSGTNDWGLTCGLSSTAIGLKERVHEAFDGLTDEFESEMIGDITKLADPEWKHLLDEADRRAT